MTFVSYAQNFEDVILWRVLNDVKEGFYIDVGAYDPCIESVTKAFYEGGWRGINIEPVARRYHQLCEDRKHDINLHLAVGAKKEILPYYEIDGLSTLKKKIAEHHQQKGIQVNEIKMDVVTLAEICRKYVQNDIHFLKIDVEGAEREVLLGMDFDNFRPWVILLEATFPNSQKETYDEWESLLLQYGYDFVYFDGLNRFYLAKEHAARRRFFNAPPNVFDKYVKFSEVALEKEVQRARNDLEQIAAKLKSSEISYAESQVSLMMLAQELSISLQSCDALYQQWLLANEKVVVKTKESVDKQLQLQLLDENCVNLRQQLEQLGYKIKELVDDKARLTGKLSGQLNDILHSKSWRIIKPLHKIKQIFHKVFK